MKIIPFFFLFLSCTAYAQPSIEFSKANDLYKGGKYAEAEKLYESILLSGNESADVYFNLGNSFFKQSKISQAILNYERAARLAPGDADIQFNIKVANSRIVDKIELMPDIFYSRWGREIKNIFSADEWATASIILVLMAIVFGAIAFVFQQGFVPQLAKYLAIFSTLFLCFSLGFGYYQFTKLKDAESAIIFTPTLNVKSSPTENGTNIFVIHEGLKVDLEDRVGTWVKIRLENGNIGWAQESSLVVI
jgi:tetratricopeptide (TPR) repeat protein